MKSATIQIVGQNKINDLLNVLKRSNQEYELIYTPHSLKVKIPSEKLNYFCTPDYTALSCFGQLSSIKSYLNNSGRLDSIEKVNPGQIRYFKYKDCMYFKNTDQKGLIKRFDNVREVDISAAYVNSAYNLDLIRKDHYEKLIKGPKKNRLKILGALATQKQIEYWRGPHLIDEKPDSNKELRNVWFNIVKNVDNAMNEVFSHLDKSALFYFVDNLYFKNSPGIQVGINKIFQSYNFKIKSVPLNDFFVFNSTKGAVSVVHRLNDKEPKYFFIPNKQIKYWQIQNL